MSTTKCQGCRGGDPLPFEFSMAFQPIIDADTSGVWGYEALVRGADGSGAAGILDQVDDANRYKFDQACRVKAIELASALFPRSDDIRLSINFMPNAVYEPSACIRATLDAAGRTGFPCKNILFEFTENERMTDAGHVSRIIAEYRRHAFATALDDFGAGYAGLNLLAAFQPDFIKVDMELIRGIDASVARRAILASTLGLARELGIEVIAEGVETVEEFTVLRGIGLKLFQGYLFAKPAFEALPAVALPGFVGVALPGFHAA